MELINIKEILEMCSEPHVILKRDGDLYSYKRGEDIDVFARDGTQLIREILHLVSGRITDNKSVSVSLYQGHRHIDFSENNILVVRIDVIDSLDIFKEELLSNNKYAQLAFRLFEYAKHPEKVKHLNFIKEHIND